MSYAVSNIDYAALPADLLPLAKQHMRVDFTDDDTTITEYLKWAIAYCEQFWDWQIASAQVDWTPEALGSVSRYQCPLQPVASFTVTAGGTDVSAEYALEKRSFTEPVWLVHSDGTPFPTDAKVELVVGFASSAALPPNATANILRIAATMYEHRESVSTLSLETVPFWLSDMLDGLWIPRA